VIGNDKFVSVFGSVPAGDTTRLVQIVTHAVREGFHIVLCAPGGDTPVCTLPVTHQKREHECGAAHVLSLESLLGPSEEEQAFGHNPFWEGPGEYNPKELAKVRAKVQAIVNRVTKQQGGPPNIAVQPGPSGYAVFTRIEPHHEFIGIAEPTVVDWFNNRLWYWYTIPKMPDATEVSILVPPSTVNGYPLRLIGQTNPAPGWLLDRITQTT
jgi:hypothetical protein